MNIISWMSRALQYTQPHQRLCVCEWAEFKHFIHILLIIFYTNINDY